RSVSLGCVRFGSGKKPKPPRRSHAPKKFRSHQIDGQAFKIGERAVRQGTFVSGAQNDARRLVCFQGFLPARRAQAPATTGFQAWKAELGGRGREIIAPRS